MSKVKRTPIIVSKISLKHYNKLVSVGFIVIFSTCNVKKPVLRLVR